MSQEPADLRRQAEEFGQQMAGLLCATLPGLPDPPIEVLTHEDRSVIRPAGPEGGHDLRIVRLPLQVQGEVLASLDLSVACQLDSNNRYLAIQRSSYGLTAAVDRTPVLRIDYRRDMHSAPSAHIQVHGHRGALSHLLSRAGHDSPHDMSALHIPVGGSRFRPCLEDFIQFLIAECRFDSKPGWQAHVEAGRERWRLLQAATVARDMPEEAARVLRDLGYEVKSPDPAPPTSAKALHNW
jgi:hypothetical protein